MNTQTARLPRTGVWVAGLILVVTALFNSGASAQEVLPVPLAPFKG